MQSVSQQNPVPWGEGVNVVQMKSMKYVQEPDPGIMWKAHSPSAVCQVENNYCKKQ